MDWLDLPKVQGTHKSLLQHHSSNASILWYSAFFMVQLSQLHMTTGKTIGLTRWIFVSKIMSLLLNMLSRLVMGFPCGLAGKESTCNAGDLALIPGLGRSPGEGKGYPLHYSGLENPVDWIVHGVKKSKTRLSDFHFQVVHSFSSKEEASFNFMAAVTICSDFGAQEGRVCHYFHCFPIYLPWSDGTRCHDLSFLNVEF